MSGKPSLPEVSDKQGREYAEKQKITDLLDDLARQLVETRKAYLIQLQDVLARERLEDKYL